MNIEQEFKELHELLLCAYDEDYEESLDKALSKLDNLKKQLLLHNVSGRSEQLVSFLRQYQKSCEIMHVGKIDAKNFVEQYKTN